MKARIICIGLLALGIAGMSSEGYASKGRSLSSATAKTQVTKDQLREIYESSQRQKIKEYVEGVDVEALLRKKN